MLFCLMQQCVQQQQHSSRMLLPCERNAMLEQLLLDILCGPHLCACMPAVCTMPAHEDVMSFFICIAVLQHVLTCLACKHAHVTALFCARQRIG